jgi:hypothetical protein
LTDGKSEPPPEWLVEEMDLFEAAKGMNVAPWELADRSIYWRDRALFFESVRREMRLATRGKNKAM